jgi:hypothetical protein
MIDGGLYARWREAVAVPPHAANDALAVGPPERWLQQIWRHQRLRRGELRTLDGQALRILHPGFWNREPGPDFRDAVIQFGDQPPLRGAVEIDVAASAWRGHGHDRNPAFAGVILRVVWTAPAVREPVGPVCLALEPFLDTPLNELAGWLEAEAPELTPLLMSGRCAAPLRTLPGPALVELCRQAAAVRLGAKAAQLSARAKIGGWERALWEGLFAALGYKHNAWPFRVLAETLDLGAHEPLEDAAAWEARLLGLAGLLPAPAGRKSAPALQSLWDIWWRERERFHDRLLPEGVWQFAGIRPANHPQRRLALAARWLAQPRFVRDLEAWLHEARAHPAAALLERLSPRDSGAWARQWTLAGRPVGTTAPLLGAARATDLAMNILLPWFLARARAGGNETLCRRIETWYLDWPAGEDNALLKLTRQRLLGDRPLRGLRGAAVQQGLLQIARDFCARSDAICSACQFPALVGAWAATEPGTKPGGTATRGQDAQSTSR